MRSKRTRSHHQAAAGAEAGLIRILKHWKKRFGFWMLLLALSVMTACRRGMVQQQYVRPLAQESFFADQRGSRLPSDHAVAQGGLPPDEQFLTGRVGQELAATLPVPLNRELLKRGQERFDIYCSVCHGRAGVGNGMIVQRGFPQPPSYHQERLRKAPLGYFFHVITNGYGVMFSYAQRIIPEDRWAIAAYIRVLQLSRNASPADAGPGATGEPGRP